MKKLLQELVNTKIVKITGSYADGSQNNDSDIDFYVKDDKPDIEFKKRNIRKIITILNKHNIKWNSSMISTISTIGSNNPNLKIQLEFSDLFKKRPNKLKKVIIDGIKFNTF